MEVGPLLSSSLHGSWAAPPAPSWNGGLDRLSTGNCGFGQGMWELRRGLIPEPAPGNSTSIPKSGCFLTIRSELLYTVKILHIICLLSPKVFLCGAHPWQSTGCVATSFLQEAHRLGWGSTPSTLRVIGIPPWHHNSSTWELNYLLPKTLSLLGS